MLDFQWHLMRENALQNDSKGALHVYKYVRVASTGSQPAKSVCDLCESQQ